MLEPISSLSLLSVSAQHTLQVTTWPWASQPQAEDKAQDGPGTSCSAHVRDRDGGERWARPPPPPWSAGRWLPALPWRGAGL